MTKIIERQTEKDNEHQNKINNTDLNQLEIFSFNTSNVVEKAKDCRESACSKFVTSMHLRAFAWVRSNLVRSNLRRKLV